jgi:hypothetical protein
MTPLQIFASCLMLSAQTYAVPPQVMVGILHVEGGKVGQEVGPNVNGTYDLGPMQVNTIWLPQLAGFWNVDTQTAHKWVRDNSCVNLHVSAWILRQKLNEAKGNLFNGIARYHSATPEFGHKYAYKVIKAMDKQGLIDYGTARPVSSNSNSGGKTIRVAER